MKQAGDAIVRLARRQQSAGDCARALRAIGAHAASLPQDGRRSTAESVHEARLLVKRMRALLWFAKPALSDKLQGHLRAELRNAARFMARLRDAKAAKTTLKKISVETERAKVREAVGRTLRALHAPPHQPGGEGGSLRRAVKLIAGAADLLAGKIEKAPGWPAPKKRVAKAARATRRAEKKALRTRADADFHAWRKKAKRLLFLLEFQDTDPSARGKQLLERVDELQATLGDDHDCVVTAAQLTGGKRGERRRVARLLDRRKRRLRRQSRKLARRVDRI